MGNLDADRRSITCTPGGQHGLLLWPIFEVGVNSHSEKSWIYSQTNDYVFIEITSMAKVFL